MTRTVNNSLVNELRPSDMVDNPCVRCQCSTCTNDDCPAPCRAHMGCMSPVTQCGQHEEGGVA